jgi:hypothetical protein
MKVIGMSSVRDAELVEAANQGLVHNNLGELIDLSTHQKFSTSDFKNANRIYRFGGKIPFTLADHIALCLLLAKDTSVEQRAFLLLHEQYECVSGIDLPYPIKHTWPWYVENEERYLKIIYEKHGLDYSKYGEMVKGIDRKCAMLEARHFFYKEHSPEVFMVQGTRPTYLINKYAELFPKEVREHAAR